MARGLRGVDVVGADLVEVSPPFDPSGGTAWLGISLMFEMLCVMAERVAQGLSAGALQPRTPGDICAKRWKREGMKAEMIVTNAQGPDDGRGAPAGRGGGAWPAGAFWRSGSRAEVEALAGPATRVIDAGGRTLLPGFVESHLHLVLGGNELSQLQLGGV